VAIPANAKIATIAGRRNFMDVSIIIAASCGGVVVETFVFMCCSGPWCAMLGQVHSGIQTQAS
jgi:hypothetical protein